MLFRLYTKVSKHITENLMLYETITAENRQIPKFQKKINSKKKKIVNSVFPQ